MFPVCLEHLGPTIILSDRLKRSFIFVIGVDITVGLARGTVREKAKIFRGGLAGEVVELAVAVQAVVIQGDVGREVRLAAVHGQPAVGGGHIKAE